VKSNWWRVGDTVVVVNGQRYESYPMTPTIPIGVVNDFEAILRSAELRCRPRLAMLESAGGAVGFHIGGLVALGERDLIDLGQRVMSHFAWRRTPAHHVPLLRFGNPNLVTTDEVMQQVVRIVLAHEVGHSWAIQSGNHKAGIAGERVADQFAGMIAQALGWRSDLDALTLAHMGCVGPSCSHPSPSTRVADYEHARRFIAPYLRAA